ncbi:hypothetical protein HY389_02210 [Candidatus Daviesbacteria bacterium]|nr:hypothetical protein [Candidatus Daviesbacteria bacterium]
MSKKFLSTLIICSTLLIPGLVMAQEPVPVQLPPPVSNQQEQPPDQNQQPDQNQPTDQNQDKGKASVGIGTTTSASGLSCGSGVNTAIGCIPTDPQALIQKVLQFATGAGGGIALLLMIYGAFQMMTSAGNPEQVKKGADQLTSAVIGLLFIIFSVLLLQIIGFNILNIPGFK